MLLTSWLLSLRNGLARRWPRKVWKARKRPVSRRMWETRVEKLEDRSLLSGPGLVSITPNVGGMYLDNDVRGDAPRELTFQFSPGQSIVLGPSASDSGLQVTRAGGDGTFSPALMYSDFGTNGAVVVEIDALRLGAGGNNISLIVTTNDLGPSSGPVVSMNASQISTQTIGVTLNTNALNRTTAQALVNAINSHAVSSTLVNAKIRSGVASTVVSGITSGTSFNLDGANAATASLFETDFGLAQKLEVRFTATTAGSAGNGVSLFFRSQNLGTSTSAPGITVSGKRIDVVLNSNATAFSTPASLAGAIAANPAAAALVKVSTPVGNATTTNISTSSNLFSPVVLGGSNDVTVDPGFVGAGNPGSSANFITLRFKDVLPDDKYRIEIFGNAAETSKAFIRGTGGLAFNSGVDQRLNVTLNTPPQVTSVVPQPVLRDKRITINNIAQLTDGDRVTINDGQITKTFELNSTGGVRSGNVSVAFTPGTDTPTSLAVALANAITGSGLDLTVSSAAGVVTIKAAGFQPTTSSLLATSTGLSLTDGALTQLTDVVNVFFNKDTLSAVSANNPAFYQLVDTATNQVLLPSSVTYNSGSNNAKLKFSGPLASTTYHLKIGSSTESDDTRAAAVNVGTVFVTQPYTTIAYVGDGASTTTPVTGSQKSDDVDLYKVVIGPTGGAITATVSPRSGGLNTFIRIFDSTGNPFGTADTGGPGSADVFNSVALTPGETYYIGVSNDNNVSYDLATDPNTIDGATTGGSVGGYALTIAVSGASPVVNDINTSFAEAAANANLGTLGAGGQTLAADIAPQTALLFPPLPGGTDEPGHRDIPLYDDGGAGSGQTPVSATAIPTHYYYFPDVYGNDPQGNQLHNAITANQKARTREIFELYSNYAGIQFVEHGTTVLGGTPVGFQATAIVTGDPRVLAPNSPVTVSRGGAGMAIISNAVSYGNSEYGGSWFNIAFHEFGHSLGLGHVYNMPAVQGSGLAPVSGDPNPAPIEQVFPGDVNTTIFKRLNPPTSTDIDLYQFNVEQTGQFSAEISARRSGTPSLLDSVLTLYKATTTASLTTDFNSANAVKVTLTAKSAVVPGMLGNSVSLAITTGPFGGPPAVSVIGNTINVTLDTSNGNTAQELVDAINIHPQASRLVTASVSAGNGATNIASTATNNSQLFLSGGVTSAVSRNDDYYGKDSFIDAHLEPGTYYIGVTSTGNTSYDPDYSNTGFGGQTDGAYTLTLKLAPDAPPASSITDVPIPAIPAFANGQQLDGDHDGDPGGTFNFWFKAGSTIFVDKVPFLPVSGPVGSITNPYNNIGTAIANVGANEIIRIVGNGGVDGNVTTVADNQAYLVGRDVFNNPLTDGLTFNIPRNVTVMIDAGVDIKFRGANIDVGTSALGIDRSRGAVQVLGTPNNNVILTSYADDSVGGDSNGPGALAAPGDWGGIVYRADSDSATPGVFLNSVNQATITYGGGQVLVNSVLSVFNPVHMITSRPAVWFNTIINSSDAAMSADPNSFDDSLGRIGPDIHGNILTLPPVTVGSVTTSNTNSINGLFVRIRSQAGQVLDTLSVNARFAARDFVYVVTENLLITGSPGNSLNATTGGIIPSGRLKIDPGAVVKFSGSRIETQIGGSQFLAEGTDEFPIVFTSLKDTQYGLGGTFDTIPASTGNPVAPGQWGGFFFNATSSASIDHAVIAYGGGTTPIEGGFDKFNAVEIQQADVRITNSLFRNNDNGLATSVINGLPPGYRNNLLNNTAATIFIRGAQPIIVNNVFTNNAGSMISINADALTAVNQPDYGRDTGDIDAFTQFTGNSGPLVRLNRISSNGTNGMEIRPEFLNVESVWDDTDIVHVLRGEIVIGNFYTSGGLRLQSSTTESLVVKLSGATAGFTANGIPLEIDDRIGGTFQAVGSPGHDVVFTSLNDDTIGASFDPNGNPQTDTNNDGVFPVAGSTGPAAGQWRSIKLEKYSNDRNVAYVVETEAAVTGGTDVNAIPDTAQFLGTLADDQNTGDDYQPLGFEIHGLIATDTSKDQDVYSFVGKAGTEVWFDIDKSVSALDTVLELLDANGTVLARSNDSQQQDTLVTPEGLVLMGQFPPPTKVPGFAGDIIKEPSLGGDFFGVNPRDAGMRVELLGPAGTSSTYFIRVTSNGGLTEGAYQLQVRTRQIDEKPGSTVSYSDIRYATNGIEIYGLPSHSPLMGESTETGTGTTPATAQSLGNLLASDRNTVTVSGSLSAPNNVDWYSFDLDYNLIQSIGGVNSALKTFPVVLDIDYADGLVRPNATISIFEAATGNLIFVSRDSNITDDQTVTGATGNDLLARGSFGKLDPFIGSAQLPATSPDPNTGLPTRITYLVAVSSDQQLPTALDAWINLNANSPLIRLEPITSVQRVVEDHIGYTGYTSGNLTVGLQQVSPTTPAILPINNAAALSNTVQPFSLADVVLFVSTTTSLRYVNPLNGQINVGAFTGAGYANMQDITMRPDGVLFGYQSLPNAANTAGALVTIDPSTAVVTTVGNDSIPNTPAAPAVLPFEARTTDTVDALAFRRTPFQNPQPTNPSQWQELYYSVGVPNNGIFSRLYRANPTNGSAVSTYNGNVGVNGLVGSSTGQNAPITTAGAQSDNNINLGDNTISARTTGMAFDYFGGNLYAVSGDNKFFQVSPGASGDLAGSTGRAILGTTVDHAVTMQTIDLIIDPSGATSQSGTFAGMTLGPQNVQNGAYANTFFVVTTTGVLLALDATGQPQTVFDSDADGVADAIFTQIPNIAGATGLAFSPLDINLWHPTAGNSGNNALAGHGINVAVDNTRAPGSVINRSASSDIDGRPHTEANPGASFYFGLEQYVPIVNLNTVQYLRYRQGGNFTDGQYGVMPFNFWQQDLSQGQTRNNVSAPGGAYGTLITNAFDLSSFNRTDKPTLYFNYFLGTDGTNSTPGAGGGLFSDMRDSARVWISNDDGLTWNLIASNNSTRPGGVAPNAGELSSFGSVSRDANPNLGHQDVQELFDNTATFRQARIDLADYVGSSTVKLRFDFSTGGLNPGLNPQDNKTSTDPTLNDNQFGNMRLNNGNQPARALANTGAGWFIDDLIIGLAERGEMVTAAGNQTGFSPVPSDNTSLPPAQSLTGPYQLEIRRGTTYIDQPLLSSQQLIITGTYDTNTRFVADTTPIGLPATDDFDTPFSGFNLPGWNPVVNPSLFWSVAPGFGALGTNGARSFQGMLDNETSTLQIVQTTGSGFVTFDWGVDSDSGTEPVFLIPTSDDLEFYLDGVLMNSISGSQPYGTVALPGLPNSGTAQSYFVTAGVHTFMWRYVKDGFSTGAYFGQDAGFIDNVSFPVVTVGTGTPGDQNVYRDQGHIQIASNSISDVLQVGILIDNGTRNNTIPGSNLPFPGSVRNLPTLNTARLVPSINVSNNVIYNIAAAGTGILFSGDNNPAGTPVAVVPYGRIVNNTIVGTNPGAAGNSTRGRGIFITDNASPTLLNNIISYTVNGIDIDTSSQAAGTVYGTNLFKSNGANYANTLGGAVPTLAASDIVVPTGLANPVFVSPTPASPNIRNFYLAPGTQAIDSSLNSLQDRVNITAVAASIGLPPSPILAPNLDRYGQLRVDDPSQSPPPGLGSNIFKDRGAVDRVDFVGPGARLFVPLDNDPTVDNDPAVNSELVFNPPLFSQIALSLSDSGIGVDDSSANVASNYIITQRNAINAAAPIIGATNASPIIITTGASHGLVTGSQVQISGVLGNTAANGLFTVTVIDGTRFSLNTSVGNGAYAGGGTWLNRLVSGTDYIFVYNSNTDQVQFNALTTFPLDSIYTIRVLNTNLNSNVKDLAGNLLLGNQPDGSAVFTLIVTDSQNNPPTLNTIAAQSINEGGTITFSTATGNPIVVSDIDAFLGVSGIQLKLTAPSGTLSLNPAAIPLLNFSFSDANGTGAGDGLADATMTFRGSFADVNVALNGLVYTPSIDFNGVENIEVVTNDLGSLGPPPSNPGISNPPLLITVNVNPVNDPPSVTVPGPQSTVEDVPPGTFFINGISVSDIDNATAPNALVRVTLSTPNGLLTLDTGLAGGITAGEITGGANGSGSIVITSTINAINTTLGGGLGYRGVLNFAGTDTLTVAIDDRVGGVNNGGAGSGFTASGQVSITVAGNNDPPTLTVPGPQSTPEDPLNFVILGIGADDPDAGAGTIRFTLSVPNAASQLTIVTGGIGVLPAEVTGNGTNSLVVTSTLARIKSSLLSGVRYQPPLDTNGSEVLSLTLDDQGNSGTGVTPVANGSVTITVNAVNDPPVRTFPDPVGFPTLPPVIIDEAATATSVSLGLGGVAYAPARTTATDELGSQTIVAYVVTQVPNPALGKIVLAPADGGADVVVGTNYPLAQLRNMRFVPVIDASGSGVFTYTVRDSADVSGTVIISESITITVNAVNNNPVVSAPTATVATAENSPVVLFGISVTDIDAGTGNVSLTISATGHGNITIKTNVAGGITASDIGAGQNGTSSVTITSTIAKINATLGDANGVTYLNLPGVNGIKTIDLTASDLGNTGSGGPKTGTNSITLLIDAVNDRPVRIGGTVANLSVAEDSGITSLGLGAVDYAPGPAIATDESGQVLTYFVTAVPNPALGTIILNDVNNTVVVAGQQYNLVDIQGMRFRATDNANSAANGGPGTFTYEVRDTGGTANGGVDVLAETITITVTADNDVPTVTVPGPQTVAEDASLTVTGVSVADFDANGATNFRVTFSALNGTMTVSSSVAGGLTLSDFTGGVNSGATVTVTSSLAKINATLLSLNPVGLSYRGNSRYNGPDTITITANDNGNTGPGTPPDISQTIGVTVTPVNNAPSITGPSGTLTLNEGVSIALSALTPPVVVSDVDANGATNFIVNLSAVNGNLTVLTNVSGGVNPSLNPTDNILGNGSGSVTITSTLARINATLAAVGGVSYQGLQDYAGTDAITIVANDNGNFGSGGAQTSNTLTINVSVTPVNDAPVRVAGSVNDLTVSEDSPFTSLGLGTLLYSPGPATATDENAGQSLSYTVITLPAASLGTVYLADNVTVVTAPSNYNIVELRGMVFKPAANQSGGPATFSFRVTDNGGTANGGSNILTESLTITVTSVNDAPTLTAVPDPAAILEEAAEQTINLSGIGVGPGNESGQTLTTFTVASDNTSLIPTPTLTYTPGASTATLKYTPVPNQFGTAIITLTLTDDGGTANGGIDMLVRTFTVTVLPVNDRPALDAISNFTLPEDADVQQPFLTGINTGPANESTQVITISAVSSNPAIVPDPLVVYPAGNPTIGLLQFKPAPDASGTVTITVTATDTGGTSNGGINSVVRTFTITVLPLNDTPTLDVIPDINVAEDAGVQTINMTGISTGSSAETSQQVTITAVSSNTALIPNPLVTYTSPGATGTLTYTPTASMSGSATITVTVKDNGGTANSAVDTLIRTFTINVNSVNDAPTINNIPSPPAIKQDSGLQTINLSGISVGAANESGQVISITATSSNIGLIPDPTVNYTSASATGTLTFTPLAGQSGSVIITVTVMDDGGVANGGIDTTIRTFNVSVVPNAAPVITPIPNQSVNEESALIFSTSASDSDDPQNSLVFSAAGLPSGATFNPTTHVFSWTPTEAQGPQTYNVSFSVTDGKSTSTQNVQITVNEVNRTPVVTAAVGSASAGTIVYNIAATDADLPAQTLVLSALNMPNGATFNAATGVFSWTPTAAQHPGTYVIIFSAFDGIATGTSSVTIELTSNGGGGTTPNATRMFRAYNPNADYHFFTTAQPEFANAVVAGYRDETTGQAGWGVSPSQAGNSSTVFRLYNKQTGRHYYTTSAAERDFLVNLVPPSNPNAGWRYEKNEGFIFPSTTSGTTEIFRLYNRNSGVHLYTESAAQKDSILAQFPGVWEQHTSLGFGYAFTTSGSVQPLPATAAATAMPATALAVAAPMQTVAADDSAATGTDVGTGVSLGTISTDAAQPAMTSGSVTVSPTTSIRYSGTQADDDDVADDDIDGFWSSLGRNLALGSDLLDN